jgi:hypothetical protein
MKHFRISIGIIIFFSLLINSSCKKKADCGCNSGTLYYLPRIAGELSYNQYKAKWMLSYSPGRGAFRNFFPCNTNQDSLKAILQGTSQTQSFVVWFSGDVKSPCANEDFGPTNGITTVEYITLTSLSRN